jgi:ribosomal protein L7/L12
MDPWQVLGIVALVSLLVSLPRLWSARGADYGQLARVEQKLDLVLKHLGLATELRVEVPARVHELAQTGQKVAAIKLLRQTNPWLSLREAKDYVEGSAGRP